MTIAKVLGNTIFACCVLSSACNRNPTPTERPTPTPAPTEKPPPTEVQNALSAYSAHEGHLSELLRAESLDIQITPYDVEGTEMPQLDFRNRFEKGIDIRPCLFSVEYDNGMKVEGTNTCDGFGMVVGKSLSRSPITVLHLKDAPSGGKLTRVDLVYGNSKEIPKTEWVRFVAIK